MNSRDDRGRTGAAQVKSRWDALRTDGMIGVASVLPTDAEVGLVGELFDVPLPSEWISWVKECGSLHGFGRHLLGLRSRGLPTDSDALEDAYDVLTLLRLTEPAFPSDLLPIEVLPERQLHCVVVAHGTSRVVLIDLDRPHLRLEATEDLAAFVYEWRGDLHAAAAVVEAASSAESGDEAVLLRPDEWSTRRLCSQNVIVGLLQTRHNRDTNEHDVAVFAVTGLAAFAPGAPTRWALTTVLTEAFQAGGGLAVNFVTRQRGRDGFHRDRTRGGLAIPPSIVRWARGRGIHLDRRATGWDDDTGRRLYVAAANLTESLRGLLPDSPVPAPAVCAAIATGTWPALEVECLLRWTDDPGRILAGGVPPSDRVRYAADQHVVRSSILLSALLRHLQRAGQASASDEDDTVRDIAVRFEDERQPGLDPTLGSLRFSTVDGKPLAIEWPSIAGQVPAGDNVLVRVLAASMEVLIVDGPAVIAALERGEVLLVPADVSTRGHDLRAFISAAEAKGVIVLAAPEYTTTMDVTIAARLDRSRMSRQ